MLRQERDSGLARLTVLLPNWGSTRSDAREGGHQPAALAIALSEKQSAVPRVLSGWLHPRSARSVREYGSAKGASQLENQARRPHCMLVNDLV